MTMRVLVTGGAGFIGSHIVEDLLASGHDVEVLDNLSSGRREHVHKDVPLHRVDLRDHTAVARCVAQVRPDVVSHHAAHVSVSASVRSPTHDGQINYCGSAALLEACLYAEVRRVVFASTGGAIYGNVPSGVAMAGVTPTAPSSPYAVSKLAFEHLLKCYAASIEVVVLRYANVYGPRQSPHGEAGVVAIFAEALRAGQTVKVYGQQKPGDGGCVRDYVHVRDVARVHDHMLTAPVGVHNVGTGQGTSTATLLSALSKCLSVRPDVVQEPPRDGDVARAVVDSSLLRAVVANPIEISAGLATV